MISTLVIGLAAQATAIPASAADPGSQVRCVREEVIGSLVQTRKVCHTLREWEVIRRNGRDEANRVVVPEGRAMNQPG